MNGRIFGKENIWFRTTAIMKSCKKNTVNNDDRDDILTDKTPKWTHKTEKGRRGIYTMLEKKLLQYSIFFYLQQNVKELA